MEIDKNRLTFAVLAAVIASMTFAANGGIKPTFAQITGVTPPPSSSSTDQAASNKNATSGTMSNMNMSSASSGTNKTTVVRDSQTILLEGKTLPA
ncbi:MAG: hypothetical protein JO297_12505, partial [Nitrososphaeraceae archaeon]|nr:hypothetical protein [Nitrososphaeraceae archaeon]